MKKLKKLTLLIVASMICMLLIGKHLYAAEEATQYKNQIQVNDELYPEYEGETEIIQFSMKSRTEKEFNAGLAVDRALVSAKYGVPNYVIITITPQASS